MAERYQIEEAMSASVFGELYRCQDISSGLPVSLRILRSEWAREREFEQAREQIRIASAVEHRNIITTFGAGCEGAVCYVVQEVPVGQTLRDVLERKWSEGRTLSVKGAVNLSLHLCAALDHAGKAGLVHGAVTPSSVFVDSGGRVKVGDFGLAALLRESPPVRGRPLDALELSCLAPELQMHAGHPPMACNIFSVGTILHMALVGRPPTQPLQSVRGIIPELPNEVDGVLARCLAVSPADRYANLQELRNALRALVHEEAVTSASQMEAGPPPTERHIAPVVHTRAGALTPPPAAMNPSAVAKAPPPRPAAAQPPPAPVEAKQPVKKRPRGHSKLYKLLTGQFSMRELLGGVDENQERWLVERDRLDYGPFSLAELKRQIEAGAFSRTHTVVDQTTGERTPIGEHPLLRDFMEAVEEARERKRRAEADHAQHKAEKRGRATVWLTTGSLAIVGVLGVWFYIRHARQESAAEQRRRAMDLEGVLKSIDIAWKPMPKLRRARGRGRSGGGGGAGGGGGMDDFDSPLELGSAEESGGDDMLSDDVIQSVMTKNFGSLKGCVLDAKRRESSLREVSIEFVVKGDGRVSAVRANGERAGPLHQCLLGQMKKIAFPSYNGSRTIAGFSMMLK